MMHDDKKAELLKRLLKTFHIEAEENIQTLSVQLTKLQIEQDSTVKDNLVESIYRSFHSLKGASRAAGLAPIERLCQHTETIMGKIKNHEISVTPDISKLLFHVVDILQDGLKSESMEFSEEQTVAATAVIGQLRTIEKQSQKPDRLAQTVPPAETKEQKQIAVGGEPLPLPPIQQDSEELSSSLPSESLPSEFLPSESSQEMTAAPHASVRIAKSTLDSLLMLSEELPNIHLTVHQRMEELHQLLQSYPVWQMQWKRIQPKLKSNRFPNHGTDLQNQSAPLQTSMREVLMTANQIIEDWHGKLSVLSTKVKHDKLAFQTLTGELQAELKLAGMLPCSALLDDLPRMVRDLSADLGKDTAIEIHGRDIVVDKRILEELQDPIIHLIRNSVDHGIERAASRREAGKEEQGRLFIAVKNISSNQIEITIQDDGAGISLEEVRKRAAQLHFIEPNEAGLADEQTALSWIFLSGLSTSKIISGVSGRGLGLAIVRDKVERLSGTVSVTTKQGKGTSFRIQLPSKYMAYRGIIVRSHDRFFVLATSHVKQVFRINRQDIFMVENRSAYKRDEQVLPIVPLHSVLGLSHPQEDLSMTDYSSVIDLESGDRRIFVLVDEVVGEQEIIVKPLGKQLLHVKNIAGAAVMGAGELAPIINVQEFVPNAIHYWEQNRVNTIKETRAQRQHTVLVVEDSITSRTLLRTILESSGFQVETAVDGQDAFTKLKQQPFDIVVTDVDMPKLNGFGLTEKIRADESLALMPVVLVTSLSSAEDRERGAQVGANAYIIKSNFDQTNLLDIIGQLI